MVRKDREAVGMARKAPGRYLQDQVEEKTSRLLWVFCKRSNDGARDVTNTGTVVLDKTGQPNNMMTATFLITNNKVVEIDMPDVCLDHRRRQMEISPLKSLPSRVLNYVPRVGRKVPAKPK